MLGGERIVSMYRLNKARKAFTAERLLRTSVVGRKNFYGHQAAWSGELSAAIWSIQNTCELHRLDPLRYLTEYLTACAGLAAASLWRDRN